MAHVCGACVALLEPDDGHDRCPSCLGFEHLREGLTERACMNCGSMPLALRLARLAAVEHPAAADLPLMTPPPPAQPGRSWRRGRAGPPPRKRARDELASKVDRLSSDMVRIQELLLTLQPGAGGAVADSRPDPSLGDVPGTDDVLSLAASANLFSEGVTGEEDSNAFGEASRSSAQSSGHSTEGNPIGAVIRTALARLGLDAPKADLAQPSAFFRRSPATAPFSVPPSEEYLKELHFCWKDAKALPRPSASARALAAMRDPAQYGLGSMPPVEPAIASLILTPDQALRPDARCPRPQCRVTDDLLSKAYDAAARMGRIGNSLSHLMLALSTSLQQAAVEPSTQDLSDASLQDFALMSRELGRVMSTLVQTRRQVWLAQSAPDGGMQEGPQSRASGLEPPRLPPGAATSHHALTQREMRTYVGLGGLPSSPLIAFAPPPAHRPGSLGPRSLIGTPPEPVEAGGPGARTTGPVVGCFSQQQISYWAACTTDPWVVSTLTRGYELQFRRRPQAFGRVRMTVVRDPTKAAALAQELSALLAKDEVPDQQNQNSGLVLVVDNAEYKKYGSRKTVAARMLAVVNHVDKLYRSPGTRVMLVGLEIWTYGDQMEDSPDPSGEVEERWRRGGGGLGQGTPTQDRGDPHTGDPP
ncbi:unnamed protein product [Boreogadus saida]